MCESETAGILRVEVDTETPYLDVFLVQVDGGEWRECEQDVFGWELREGLNRLRVKVRNSAGVCGPESSVSVVANG